MKTRNTKQNRRSTRKCAIAWSAVLILLGLCGITPAQSQVLDSGLAQIAQTSHDSQLLLYRDSVTVSALQLFSTYDSLFGLGPDDAMVLQDTTSDSLGYKQYRFQQQYRGVPVDAGDYIVQEQMGHVRSSSGRIITGLQVGITPSIDEGTALQAALGYVNANTYMWQVQALEDELKDDLEDSSATYYPTGEIIIAGPDSSFQGPDWKLCYRFDIYSADPMERQYVYVNAYDGTIVNAEYLSTDATGTADTYYNGQQEIVTNPYYDSFELTDYSRGDKIVTKTKAAGKLVPASQLYDDDSDPYDNYWHKQDTSTQAHWSAEMTYDFYLNHLGRDSYDDDGHKVRLWTNCNWIKKNASWDGVRIKLGVGKASDTVGPYVTLDIVGHEFTHAVVGKTAKLKYKNESGALNESFADIFGTMAEYYTFDEDGDSWTFGNWSMGSETGHTIRSFISPPTYGDPDYYEGTNWATDPDKDHGGVHTNSNVQNHWFYLLAWSTGGTQTKTIDGWPVRVDAIGRDKATAIAYRNLTRHLSKHSDYFDARDGSIISALELYGCGDEAYSVAHAWEAVGVVDTLVYAYYNFTDPNITDRRVDPVSFGEACTIKSGAGLDQSSMMGIRLEPGFHAEDGAEFSAKIACARD